MAARLVGRDPERARLAAALQAAVEGRGGLVLVSGEPGVGKTALLRDLAELARTRGLAVLSGRAGLDTGPFRPFAEALSGAVRSGFLAERPELQAHRGALGRLIPGWSPAGPPEPGLDPTLLLGEAVLQVLASGGGCLLVLDDLHEADPDSLALLAYVAAGLSQTPALLVGAFVEPAADPRLGRLAASDVVATLRLGRLSAEHVRELAGSSGDLSAEEQEHVVARAEGLPLVAAELSVAVRTGGGTVPAGFSALVDARLAALDAAGRAVLAAAAVAGGDPPDWTLAAEVAGQTAAARDAALQHALRLQLLAVDAGDLGWRHGLTREAVLQHVLPPQRRDLARRAAETMLSAEPGSARAAELLARAGESAHAGALYCRLAEAAVRSGALHSAADLLDRAERVGADPVDGALVRVSLLTLRGRPGEALDAGTGLLPAARGEAHVELCLRLARAAVAAARWALAEELVEQAGRPADPRCTLLLADAAHGAGRIAQADDLAARAVEHARAADDPDLLAEALCLRGVLARRRDLSSADAAFAEAVRVAAEHGLAAREVAARFGRGTVAFTRAGDRSGLLDARRRALDLGLHGQAASVDLLLTEDQLLREGPPGAAAAAAGLADLGRRLGAPFLRFAAEVYAAVVPAVAGDVAELGRRLAVVSGAGLPPDAEAQLAGLRALAALSGRDLEAAAAELERARGLLVGHGSSAPVFLFGLWAVVTAASGADHRAAWPGIEQHHALLRRANLAGLRFADAVTAGRGGYADEAARRFAEADELAAATAWWQRYARLWALQGAVADGWGDPVPLLRADLGAYEQAGEVALARIARDLLRRAGAPTRRGRGDSDVPAALRAAGVTGREHDVLRLVAEGLSNADVSARLFLSSRTVETHVARLLAKSGTANRGELRAWYRGLTP